MHSKSHWSAAVVIVAVFCLLFLSSSAEATEWYVNDTVTVGDSYCSAAGYDTQPGTRALPKATITAVMALVVSGDTVYVDAGTYHETVVITVDSIALIGADSAVTNLNTETGPLFGDYGFYAANRTGLLIANFGINNAYYGIGFDTCTNSVIRSDSFGAEIYAFGIELNFTAGLLVERSTLVNVAGFLVYSGNSPGSTFQDNVFRDGSMMLYDHCDTLALLRNQFSSASLDLYSSDSVTIADNAITGSFWFNVTGCSSAAIYRNTLTGSGAGLWVEGSNGLVWQNTIVGATVLPGMTVVGNGFRVADNLVRNGDTYGFEIRGTGHRVTGNLAQGNQGGGYFFSGASAVALVQNLADSNGGYAFASNSLSGPNLVMKNNFVTSVSRPDSGARSDTAGALDLTRNWWGTTDSGAIRQRLNGLGAGAISYLPFRLGVVDTAANADSVAPAAPDIVLVTSVSDTACTVVWNASASNEEIGGAPADLAGYRVYRSTTSGTSYWAPVGTTAAADTDYCDTGLATGTTYYYRVTAYDNHAPWPNESWYSDSLAPGRPAPDTSGPNVWYVNDTATGGDVYCTAIGNNANLGLAPATPFRTLNQIEGKLTAGDTIYVDAGWYYEADTFTIDTNGVFLIGKDSASTVIQFDDPSAGAMRALYVIGVAGLTIRDLRVTNGRSGVWFVNVDNSVVERVLSDSNSSRGFALFSGSDSNALLNVTASGNLSNGLEFSASLSNVVVNSTSESNGANGITLGAGSNNNSLSGCLVQNNATNGVNHVSSSGNAITGSLIRGNGSFGAIYTLSHGNTARSNVYRDNASYGLAISSSSGNFIAQNTFDSNANWAIYINGAGSTVDTFTKNVYVASAYAAFADSGLFNNTSNPIDASRNWWGSTDSAVVGARVGGSGTQTYLPYRLGIVDTAASADTIAPTAPDSVTVVDSSYRTASCTINFTAASSNEEIGGGAPGDLAGYRIYRSRTSDTSYWAQVGTTAAASYVATGLVAGETYYFRVTAYDNHNPWANESWYSDSIVCVLITSGPGDFVSTGLSANKVDTADLNYLNGQVALYWGAAPADIRCDLSGNGILDFDDIAAFAVLFGL